MSETSIRAPSPRRLSQRTIAWALVFLSGLLTVSALVLLVTGLTASQPPQPPQPSTPAPGLRLIKVVALPSIGIAPAGHAPIQALPFDGFDFQALDPHTGLLSLDGNHGGFDAFI